MSQPLTYGMTHAPRSQLDDRTLAIAVERAPSTYPAHVLRSIARSYSLLYGRSEQAGVIVDHDEFVTHQDEPHPNLQQMARDLRANLRAADDSPGGMIHFRGNLATLLDTLDPEGQVC